MCITSYNIAVTDHRAFKQMKWKYLILDEVHVLKSLAVLDIAKWPNLMYCQCLCVYCSVYNTIVASSSGPLRRRSKGLVHTVIAYIMFSIKPTVKFPQIPSTLVDKILTSGIRIQRSLGINKHNFCCSCMHTHTIHCSSKGKQTGIQISEAE